MQITKHERVQIALPPIVSFKSLPVNYMPYVNKSASTGTVTVALKVRNIRMHLLGRRLWKTMRYKLSDWLQPRGLEYADAAGFFFVI
ncbi:hypothetical protein WN48_06987 [Eufriesea mexicana]|uniref:Uncharacterized protein n=1 Tax=Eufriesea mexicana TaxID=516756 RepID=A0A310SMF2_9HYME|nr:hypothetical protein WN48_06987 [Eufriesea mexicana]